MPSPHSSRPDAFTFIELLMTVSIMLIMLSIGAANYLRFLDKQRLYQSASSIEAIIKDARAKAQNGFLGNEDIGFCDKLAGVEVFSLINADNKIAVTVQLNCATGSPLPYENYVIKENATTLDPSFKIAFLPMRGAAIWLAGGTVSEGVFILSRNGSQASFNLDQGGTVNVKYE